MGRRKEAKGTTSSSSSSSGSSEYSEQSSGCSSSSGSSGRSQWKTKLGKKDLKKLIQMEKAIKKQEKLLRRESLVLRSKPPTKRPHRELQSVKKQSRKLTPSPRPPAAQSHQITQGKKLFITGIDEKHTQDEVNTQLQKVLRSVEGVTGFRIKRKQGCPTYAFIDFASKQESKLALETLKQRKIFGERMAIYYSQDELKDNAKTKKCFECNGAGHFARECPRRRGKSPVVEATSGQLQLAPTVKTQPAEPETEMPDMGAMQDTVKRIVREKTRLSRLVFQA